MKIQQLAIGISLLAAAFFLGRMVHRTPDSESNSNNSHLVRTDDTTQPSVTDIPNVISRDNNLSLLDRLKNRNGGAPPQSSASGSPFRLPSGDSSIVREPTPTNPIDELSDQPIEPIATPDFTPLQLAGPDLAPAEPARLESDSVTDATLNSSGDPEILVGPLDVPRATQPGNAASDPGAALSDSTTRDKIESRHPSTLPNTALKRIPFQLNETAHSELSKVHRRDHQILLTTSQFQNHTVQPGETLQSISNRYYGRPDYYLDIYLANQNLMSNPSDLPIGKVIKVPVFSN